MVSNCKNVVCHAFSFNKTITMNRVCVAIVVTIILVVSGCTKTSQPDWNIYYDYFPVDEGHWIIYRVDSIAYNKLLDTVIEYNYYVRETIGESFTDLADQQWQRIERGIRHDTTAGWIPDAVFAQRRTISVAERSENNMRFIKMIFPFRKFAYWQGNSYINYNDPLNCNFYGPWDYQYKELFIPQEVNGHQFDSVVIVQQVADSGLICKNLVTEMYAKNIGLVHKRIERLTTQNTSSAPFFVRAEEGYILTYKIVDWRRE